MRRRIVTLPGRPPGAGGTVHKIVFRSGRSTPGTHLLPKPQRTSRCSGDSKPVSRNRVTSMPPLMSATMGVSCTGNESAAAANRMPTALIPKQGGPLLTAMFTVHVKASACKKRFGYRYPGLSYKGSLTSAPAAKVRRILPMGSTGSCVPFAAEPSAVELGNFTRMESACPTGRRT